jgi:multiple sugar transport system substrate-binding protein
LPDLMPAFTNMLPPIIEEGLLAPLDECLDDSGIEERLLPTASAAQRDGATYGVPLTMSPQGLLFNTELMEEAGVSMVPETPEQLLEASRQVVEETGEYGYAFQTDPSDVLRAYILSMQWILGYGSDWSTDGGAITANDPSNVEALEMMMTFYEEDLTPKGLEVTDVRTLFAEGRVAFVMEGPWVMTQIQSDNPDLYESVGFAPPPTPTSASITGGAFWVIPAESEHYDDACEYLKINLAEEAQQAWLEDLLQIPGTVVEPSDEFLEEHAWVGEMMEVAELYPGGLGYASPGYLLEAEAFRQIAVDALAQLFAGTATVPEALDEAQANLEAEFGG